MKKRIEWSDRETLLLLEVWGDHVYDLRRAKRNATVYEKMRADLMALHVEKTVDEIRRKIKNLQAKYR